MRILRPRASIGAPARLFSLVLILAGSAATPRAATATAAAEAGSSVKAASTVTAIRCGRLIDGRADEVRRGAVVIVEGERIVAVTGREAIPKGARLIDLSAFTVLPGLIDAHVHPLIRKDDYQVDHLRLSSAAKALRGLRVAQDLLFEGWTTLRVAGDADVHYAHLDLAAAIRAGTVQGPRIVGAGHYISTTGGGGDINFIAPEQSIIADGLIADGVEEMRRAVREEIKHGSTWIKVLATGAFMSAGDDPRHVHFSREEMETVVEEAARRGVSVMAHAHSADGIRLAVEAGVRSIEHGTFIDAEGVRMMKERGTWLIPTLSVGAWMQEEIPGSEALRKAVELERRYRDESRAAISKAIREGVRIGVGTDDVGYPPGYGVGEFALLVELGMTPMQAIRAGTVVNAELLGMESDIGSIEPGRLADIIAVDGDPLVDIGALGDVRYVMLGGRIVRSPGAPESGYPEAGR